MSTPNDTILITGGDGMVGKQFPAGAKPPRSELDIMIPASIAAAFARYQPSAVVHLAAMTDMLACEHDYTAAHATNVTGTANVAVACRERGIFLVYVSTCAVFDGTKSTPYIERDEPNPHSVYGQTKLLGERIALGNAPNALVVRAGWLFGGESGMDTHFVEKAIAMMKQNKTMKATDDRYGSPTLIADFATAVRSLIGSRTPGLRHVANEGVASYFDIANVIREAGLFTAPVVPVHAKTIEHPEVYRGAMEALASETVHLRNWKDALREYVAREALK